LWCQKASSFFSLEPLVITHAAMTAELSFTRKIFFLSVTPAISGVVAVAFMAIPA